MGRGEMEGGSGEYCGRPVATGCLGGPCPQMHRLSITVNFSENKWILEDLKVSNARGYWDHQSEKYNHVSGQNSPNSFCCVVVKHYNLNNR